MHPRREQPAATASLRIEILALGEELKGSTIEALMAKSDLEVGIETVVRGLTRPLLHRIRSAPHSLRDSMIVIKVGYETLQGGYGAPCATPPVARYPSPASEVSANCRVRDAVLLDG